MNWNPQRLDKLVNEETTGPPNILKLNLNYEFLETQKYLYTYYNLYHIGITMVILNYIQFNQIQYNLISTSCTLLLPYDF